MSLILDALRKSEHQRQREGGPGLSVVPESTGPRRPGPWTLALGGLLLLNLVVLAAVFMFDRDGPAPVAVTPPVASAERSLGADRAPSSEPRIVPPVTSTPAPAPVETSLRSAPVALPTRPPRNEVRSLTTETATETRPVARGSEPSPPDPGVRAGPDPNPAESPRTGGAQGGQRSAQQANADARLPRFADLVVRGELAVPNMHIDIHVYSAVAEERFVFINMRRYNEGQNTQEGPRVERIVPDGVVMEHQGQRFFMSRD